MGKPYPTLNMSYSVVPITSLRVSIQGRPPFKYRFLGKEGEKGAARRRHLLR